MSGSRWSTRWVPLCVAAYTMLILGALVLGQQRPLNIENDTKQPVQMHVSAHKLMEVGEVVPTVPESGLSIPNCSKTWEFIYLSTPAHPESVAYRVKDLCGEDDCFCRLKVSELERRREDLSVPWQKAGSVFPPGAGH